ncbi:MAG: DUF366 family protein [Desulfotomaculum sp.]|nr:DUF366 family protein [Desulfotomaculum sp.]
MISKFIKEVNHYDGSQLNSLWALRNFGLQGDSIISFRGSCDIQPVNMVDLVDVRAKDSIFSTDMLHFIIEHFDLDLEKTITRQRLLICIIKEVLEEQTGCRLKRQGDDLYRDKLKLSISIATLSPVSAMIHTGINISVKNTPVPTVSISELGWSKQCYLELAVEIANRYGAEIESIRMARCKVRGVD